MTAITSERRLLRLTAASMGLILALALWGVERGIDDGARRVWLGLVMLAFWGVVEWRMRAQRANPASSAAIIAWHRAVFASIALFVAAGSAVRLVLDLPSVGPEWTPVARRSLNIAAGGLMVVWGNYLPKLASPWQLEAEPFDWQRVHRFVGWVLTLSGVGMILAWSLLPIDRANDWARGVLITGMVLALGRKIHSLATYSGPRRRAESRSA